jgi:DnaJ-class molecular chaperone
VAETAACPMCGGVGLVVWRAAYPGVRDIVYGCDVCNGTGAVPAAPASPDEPFIADANTKETT